VERDIIATTQRPNCSYNKNYECTHAKTMLLLLFIITPVGSTQHKNIQSLRQEHN